MEQNLPIVAKRVWSMVRVVYFMLKKSITKKKLVLNLNLMAKRGKIAGKTITNLAAVFNHRHSHGGGGSQLGYEFSCSDSPSFPTLFPKRRRHHLDPDLNIVNDVLEILNNNKHEVGASPAARRLRVTDSPFPVKEAEEDGGLVDKAAEEFIRRFYTQLKHQ